MADPAKNRIPNPVLPIPQVMETKNMIYIVSEYASQGEIFGGLRLHLKKNFFNSDCRVQYSI